MTMLLQLQRVLVPHGAYDLDGDGTKNEMPLRACALAPDAAEAWARIADHVAISDMYRSADSSLAAVRAGRGAAAPGFSGHNYGLSIDLDVDRSMVLAKYRTKEQLDRFLVAYGWHCWRDDHAMPSWQGHPNEAWHYNFRSPLAAPMVYDGPRGNVAWLAGEIKRRHGSWFKPNAFEEQTMLKQLRLYSGGLDGKLGPLSREARYAFERSWGLSHDSSRYHQTLAFVSAAVSVGCVRLVIAPVPRHAGP